VQSLYILRYEVIQLKYKKGLEFFKFIVLIVFLGSLVYGYYEYKEFTAVPTTRLAAGSYYPEMPPDSHHYYLQLPIDHNDPSRGNFTDFYILSPNYKQDQEVIFWLFDNQQEAVGMINSPDDFEYFENNLEGLSYVLIGNRGVSPTLFPEVYNKNGTVNYNLALELYGSAQQIEDIEAVRQDMQKKGLLPPDGRIMLYGGSGGGFLVQQYLDKYGSHVSRALIEFSGAPDIAQQHNVTFASNLYEQNPDAAKAYFVLSRNETGASLAFTMFKLGLEGDKESQTRIAESQVEGSKLKDKYLYFKKWINPPYNFPFVSFIIGIPSELEVKVRIYELTGADLKKYNPASPQEVSLMYEWTRVVIADFLKANADGTIPTPHFSLNRSNYTGEVMVWSGAEDQDFSTQTGKWISDSYPNSQQAVFNDAHKRDRYDDYYLNFRKAFFVTGLNSSETQSYFQDTRQLKGK
jgi:pimeloyl-ACP methyl ester carboxylesterase